MSPKLLVTGATGLLGQALVNDARAAYDVVALVHARDLAVPGVAAVRVELTDLDALGSVLEQVAPDVVVHTAALVRPEACEAEPDRAQLMNVDVPAIVARYCAQAGSALVHVSTDGVYGAAAAPFREGTEPRPETVYGRTKLAGEHAVLDAMPTALVARTNFFGWSSAGNRSLAEFFLGQLRKGRSVPGFHDVEFTPLYQRDLVELLLLAFEQGLSGVRNFGSGSPLSKLRFGRAVAETFGLDPGLVQPASRHDAGLVAARSGRLTMDSSLLTAELGRRLPTALDGLRRMRDDYHAGYARLLGAQVRPSASGLATGSTGTGGKRS